MSKYFENYRDFRLRQKEGLDPLLCVEYDPEISKDEYKIIWDRCNLVYAFLEQEYGRGVMIAGGGIKSDILFISSKERTWSQRLSAYRLSALGDWELVKALKSLYLDTENWLPAPDFYEEG